MINYVMLIQDLNRCNHKDFTISKFKDSKLHKILAFNSVVSTPQPTHTGVIDTKVTINDNNTVHKAFPTQSTALYHLFIHSALLH